MKVSTNAERWCGLCHQYTGIDRPAAVFFVNGGFLRICLACLRAGVEACEASQGDRVARGSRE